MIVVDVNIVAYLLIEGDKTALARALWEKESQWHLPGLWIHEFLNLLATSERAGHLKLSRCLEVLESARTLFESKTHLVDPIETLRLATKHRLTAYDAQYIALAQSLQTPLISEDRKLRQAVPEYVHSMRSFVALADSH
jgi:predicted nucleic acid-binding protein